MADIAAVSLFQTNEDTAVSLSLDERETDELIIAMVGPVGSGVTTTGKMIEKILENTFGYTVTPIRVSDLIRSSSNLVSVRLDNIADERDRIQKLQDAGTKLRQKFGRDYLAEKCIEKIATQRIESDGYTQVGDVRVAEPRRQAYVIDSLKHPSEIALLNDVYGNIFWVFGVFAPFEVREDRLKEKGVSDADIDTIFKVDEDEDVDHGQKVRDTIQKADFFIRNDRQNTENLGKSLKRYLTLIFGTEIITPTMDETAIYNASATAAGSACLSRQVGAAIYSASGELIGKGRNDVPKPFGGLYAFEDGVDDHRCYKWSGQKCHNDDRKEKLYKEISKSLTEANLLRKGKKYHEVRDVLRATDVKNLIEYSRAIHAEMDAIISVARGGKAGLVGATLYCTTFPCHNCARHIVTSGIKRVVYIEPYPKSLALTLHKDAISTKDDENGRVTFVQYEGVAPKNILRLFEYRQARKENGKAIVRDPTTATPISRSPLDGYTQREQIVVQKLLTAEGAGKA